MGRLADKFILFVLCLATGMLEKQKFDYTAIAVLLIVFIISGLQYYIDKSMFFFLAAIIYLVCCYFLPAAFFFIPLIYYDAAYRRKYVITIVFLIPFIWKANEGLGLDMILIALFILLAVLLSMKTGRLHLDGLEIKRLRDDSRELEILSKTRQQEMSEKHESELHIATLQERNRIAREIHDNVGHMVSRAIILVGALKAVPHDSDSDEGLKCLNVTLNEAMDSIRESVHDLKNGSMDLREMIEGVLRYYGQFEVQFDYGLTDQAPREIKYCFISIIKEALSNTCRHSDATKINLILREQVNGFQLLMEDNGTQCGNWNEMHSQGIGILNMEERVKSLGGSINISNENGFKIFIFIPKKVMRGATDADSNSR